MGSSQRSLLAGDEKENPLDFQDQAQTWAGMLEIEFL